VSLGLGCASPASTNTVGNIMDTLVSFEPNVFENNVFGSDEPDYTNIAMIDLNEGLIDNSVVTSALGIVASHIYLGDTNTAIAGRIKGCLAIYEQANASSYVLETIKYGYKIVFEDDILPPPFYKVNNASALDKPVFLLTELLRLEELGCIKRVPDRPHIVNPCSVVYSNKWRCVLDASQGLNDYCLKRHTKLDDLSVLSGVLQQGDFMTVNDLDSGYWHVPIYPPHQTYLGIHFVHENGEIIYWVWAVLPLGITDAAHIFTCLTNPLMGFLRLRGVRSIIYIDDLLSLSKSFNSGLLQDQLIQETFLKGGWIFKPSKSSGPPSQKVKFLGLIVDSVKMKFAIPPDKLVKLIEGAKFLLSFRKLHVRLLASWVGLLQSCRLAIGPLVSIMTRSVYDVISKAPYWSSHIYLEDKARFQVQWWSDSLHNLNEYFICPSPSLVKCSFNLASDAGDLGFYVYDIFSKKRLVSRPFTSLESDESSTFRELTAVHETWTNIDILSSYQNQSVTHYTDNKAVVCILGGGSRNVKLQALALEIFLKLRLFDIVLYPIWISRDSEIISWADSGSRDFHSDDYSLDSATFDLLCKTFKSFTCDAMASAPNAVCSKFFSRYSSMGSSGVDFFAQKLDAEDFYYVFPPIGKAIQAVKHLANYAVSGVVVIPVWPMSAWFNFFFPDGRHAANWVKTLLLIDPFYSSGFRVGTVFKGRKSFPTCVLEFDFAQIDRFENNSINLPSYCLRKGCKYCA
jgi:hypothetical protein